METLQGTQEQTNGQPTAEVGIDPQRAERIQTEVTRVLANGTSQNQLAKQVGVSAATINLVRNRDKWHEISQQMWNRLGAHFRVDNWVLMETPNLTAIHKMCRDAQTNSRMLAVAGQPGLGKTTALRTYVEQHKNAFYLHVHGAMRPKDFLRAILRAMGSDRQGTQFELIVAIAEQLRRYDSPLLIIDDAGKLIERVVDKIQSIYDETEYHAGIVLAGTPEMANKLEDLKAKGRKGAPEFVSRIGNKKQMGFLRKPTKAVVKSFCEEMGIADKGAIKWFQDQCKDYRELRQELQNALMVARNNEVSVTKDLLDQIGGGQ
jgi:DNA transposition AAA+ family ATPase